MAVSTCGTWSFPMAGRSGCRPNSRRRRVGTVPFAIARLGKSLQENFEGPEPLGLLGCLLVRRRVVCPPAPQPLTHPANRPWPPPGVPGSSFLAEFSVDPIAHMGAGMEPNGFRAVRSQTQKFRLERRRRRVWRTRPLDDTRRLFLVQRDAAVPFSRSNAMRGHDPRIALKSSIQIKLRRSQTASTML
jgi:hypothetical protein